MVNTGSVFSETLQEITTFKLEELAKRRASFESSKSEAIESANTAAGDTIRAVEALSAGVKRCFGIALDDSGSVILDRTKHKQLEVELKNIDRFLTQARYDPSVSTQMLRGWGELLERHLETQSRKFQFADLYGKLVTEWLEADRASAKARSGTDEEFEDLGNATKLEKRMEWEKTVFTPADVDEGPINDFLADLFGINAAQDSPKSKVSEALADLRKLVKQEASEISSDRAFNVETLKWVITSLLSSALLQDEKREVLRDFSRNKTILNEIADVLNMRLAALDSWSWGQEVVFEQRRKISGIYSMGMQEDLLQAIFLEYIGIKWSVLFRMAFDKFYAYEDGTAWQRMGNEIPAEHKHKLEACLGPLADVLSVQNKRQSVFRENYFVSQLPPSIRQLLGQEAADDGEEEAEYASAQYAEAPGRAINRKYRSARSVPAPMVTACYAPQQFVGGDALGPRGGGLFGKVSGASQNLGQAHPRPPSHQKLSHLPIHLKQSLLHLLSTDIAIETATKGEISAFHSVLKDWNPLLPHETIMVVLEFLGVPPSWLAFFSKFLRAPLRFVDDDSTTTEPRIRCRGTPASHRLSDAFSESILFCLDFSVNQATNGQPLWRIQDDIWFWSSDATKTVRAWKAVSDFVEITGTSVKYEKSGSVRISGGALGGAGKSLPVDASLPKGELRWGFLCLNPSSGRFEIDQAMVDKQIGELRKQLDDKHGSILGFVQTWNSFAASFFSSNFGKPANCFGRTHVDDMLATHRRIQQDVFATGFGGQGSSGVANSVVDFLKKLIELRFGVTDIPDGYLFFPAELGGLDLQSPFVSLQQIRESTLQSPTELLEQMFRSERATYSYAKKLYESGSRYNHALNYNWGFGNQSLNVNSPQSLEHFLTLNPFLSFEEYVHYRDMFDHREQDGSSASYTVSDVFEELRKQPSPQPIDAEHNENGAIGMALERLNNEQSLVAASTRSIAHPWNGMTPYWQWVTMMYGPDIVDRFGGLSLVDAGLLPMGMVNIFREKRVTWKE